MFRGYKFNSPVKFLCFFEFIWFHNFLTVAPHPGTIHVLSVRVVVAEALLAAVPESEESVGGVSAGFDFAGGAVSEESVGGVSAGFNFAGGAVSEESIGGISAGFDFAAGGAVSEERISEVVVIAGVDE